MVSLPEHRERQSGAQVWMNERGPDPSLGEEGTVWWGRGERRQWAVGKLRACGMALGSKRGVLAERQKVRRTGTGKGDEYGEAQEEESAHRVDNTGSLSL